MLHTLYLSSLSLPLHLRTCQEMPFFDLQTYTANLRRHIASSNALLFALAFDTTATYLASATTTARLSIFSLSQIASAPPSNLRPPTPIYTHDLSRFGVINSLHTVSQSLYIATDKALLRLAWDHLLDSHSSVEHPPDVLCQGVQVNALAAMPDQNTIIIATANGHFLLAKNSASHLFPIARPIGSAAYPHCLAADPIHSDTFLAVCPPPHTFPTNLPSLSTYVAHFFYTPRAATTA